MKTKVNQTWYNQLKKAHEKAIKEEIRLVKLQTDRFFNYPVAFDLKTGCTKEEIKGYLLESVANLGKGKYELEKFINTYEPDETKKPDWKRIEAFVKNNAAKINLCYDIKSRWDVYYVISDFFCSAKWQVPESEKNNDRIFGIVGKYCKIY